MVCDIDSTKAFRIIKNLKFKKVLDSNFVQINKIKDNNDIEFAVNMLIYIRKELKFILLYILLDKNK